MNAQTAVPARGVALRRPATLAAALLVACAVLAVITTGRARAAATSATTTSAAACTVAPAPTSGPAATDAFYRYTGAQSLCGIAPGTVLKTRTTVLHIASIPLPVAAVQLLYVTKNAQGQADTDVTSVLLPPSGGASSKVVAYGSFYDSLDPQDEPSVAIAGGSLTLGSGVFTAESAVIAPMLLAGDTVDIADTEGQTADFAAGPEYGYTTLDGIRAALSSPATDIASDAGVALVGYSGGAIATGWAAQMAPSYAPDVESRLVGASMGGVLVDPDHNLHYISGSDLWAGVMPMAIVGVARAYGINFDQYLSAYGEQVDSQLQNASIVNGFTYPGLTWAQLAKPQYPEPEDVPPFVEVANQLIMGQAAVPQVPMLITQGTGGELEGTQPSATYGAGDGVMLAGDVRSYAREVCGSGDVVDYDETSVDHLSTAIPWLAQTLPWLAQRFAGDTAPNDCSSIASGNSLAPVAVQPAG